MLYSTILWLWKLHSISHHQAWRGQWWLVTSIVLFNYLYISIFHISSYYNNCIPYVRTNIYDNSLYILAIWIFLYLFIYYICYILTNRCCLLQTTLGGVDQGAGHVGHGWGNSINPVGSQSIGKGNLQGDSPVMILGSGGSRLAWLRAPPAYAPIDWLIIFY